jgi:hypothetical protein
MKAGKIEEILLFRWTVAAAQWFWTPPYRSQPRST